MADDPGRQVRFRFGVFELDGRTGELRKSGARVRLAGQPLRLLERLLDRPGDLVTREELERELWSDDTFVDFEHNLNSAMKRLRAALGDSAEHPRFIETLPRRGYRFLAPVERVGIAEAASQIDRVVPAPTDVVRSPPDVAPHEDGAPPSRALATGPPAGARGSVVRWLAPAAVLLLIAAALLLYVRREPTQSFRSIAVLPFVLANAASPEDEYLAFGMSEALITQLSKLGGLRVISQTSSQQYKGAGKPLPQIAKELGVDVVVEGSVQREGGRIRITVQLIEAATDAHLWAETYEREIGSVLSLIDDVALAVAEEIHVQVAPDAVRTSASRTVEAGVAEAYLKGRYHLGKGNEADFIRAAEYFEQALALDASHARSHAGLADYYTVTDALSPEVASAKARFHAERALQLDETLPDAHTSLAFINFYYDWNWDAAERAFTRAIELDPGHARAQRWFGLFLSAMGRHADAREHVQAALAADPIAIANHDAAATVRFNARQFVEQGGIGRGIHDLDAFDPRAHEQLSIAYLHQGRYADALDWVERGLEVSGSSSALKLIRAIALEKAGKRDEAGDALAQLIAEGEEQYLSSVFVAIGHAAFGQRSQALDRLERAYAERDAYLVLINVSPWFDPIRDEPRFIRLKDRLKFPR